eukprot:TRINITY_DN110682_c0_g1_i1.p1 TRINITY_DN110682_c0_g1~~TRINITY_DN110682_c0_g1_i1.p1  ORF type:complete len:574 (-),score=58.27 TRINITY_DN110682_c0_g1_i1:4-1704(-)
MVLFLAAVCLLLAGGLFAVAGGQTVTAISPIALPTVRTANLDITLTGATPGDRVEFAASGSCPDPPAHIVSATNTIRLYASTTFLTVIDAHPGSFNVAGKFFGFYSADADAYFGTTSWSGMTFRATFGPKTAMMIIWRDDASCTMSCGRWDDGTAAGGDWSLNDQIKAYSPVNWAGTYAVCYKRVVDVSTLEQSAVSMLSSVSTPMAFSALDVTSLVTLSPTYITFTTVTAAAAGDKIRFLPTVTLCSTITFATDVDASDLAAGATTHTIQFTLTTGTYHLCYMSSGNGDSVKQYYSGSYGLIQVFVTEPVIGDDPAARFGNQVREFDLPPRQLVPLLTAPDVVLHGAVFEGGPSEQWFDRMVLATPDDEHWMEVKVKRGLDSFNASHHPVGAFWTLDVATGVGPVAAPKTNLTVPGYRHEVPFDFLGHHVLFRRVRRSSHARFSMIGHLPRECLELAGASLHICICSAPAAEFYGSGRKDLAMRYAHLDLAIIEVRDYSKILGLLPELWGTQPMSEITRSYIKKEYVVNELPEHSTSKLPSLSGFAIRPEDVQKRCENNNTVLAE